MPTPIRYVAAGAAFLGPAALLVSDVLLIMFISEAGLLMQRVALIVFVPAIVGIAVLAHDRAQWQIGAGAALVAAGALLFPLAHQSGVPAALIASDVILLVAFWMLGARMVKGR